MLSRGPLGSRPRAPQVSPRSPGADPALGRERLPLQVGRGQSPRGELGRALATSWMMTSNGRPQRTCVRTLTAAFSRTPALFASASRAWCSNASRTRPSTFAYQGRSRSTHSASTSAPSRWASRMSTSRSVLFSTSGSRYARICPGLRGVVVFLAVTASPRPSVAATRSPSSGGDIHSGRLDHARQLLVAPVLSWIEGNGVRAARRG